MLLNYYCVKTTTKPSIMKTDTSKTIAILEKAKGFNDVELTIYWMDLSENEKDLFDNFSDFLTAMRYIN